MSDESQRGKKRSDRSVVTLIHSYGFVNFRTLHHLEEFARQRLGQKWALYMSDKELQLSYATIQ